MKKIIAALAFLVSLNAKSQTVPCGSGTFPTVDSIRKYVNVFIRGSAIDAFTNLRLNTSLVGMVQWIDCARSKGMDSIAVVDAAGSDPDTLKVYRAGAFAFYKLLPAGGGGTNNANAGSGFRILNPGTQEIKTLFPVEGMTVMDTTTNSNGVTVKSFVSVHVTEAMLRSSAGAVPATGVVYKIIKNGVVGDFIWNASSTKADDSVMVIQRTGVPTGRFLRVTNGFVDARWFGTTGDGVTDDYAALQKGINTIANNAEYPRNFYIPKGDYSISQPLIVYKWNGTDYDFVSVNIIGQESAQFNSRDAEARIKPTFTNTFAIGVQRAKSMKIKGISIEGQFNPPFDGINWREYYKRPYSTWATNYGVRDSSRSPYSGIVIDPFFMAPVGADSARYYPGLSGYYRGSGTAGGSSAVTIAEVRIMGFAVGIMLSPSAATLNADGIVVQDCAIEVCKAAYATGQRQSKGNFIRNAFSWDRVHTLVDGITYGQNQGTPPNIDGWNIAGSVIQCFQVTVQHPVVFANMFGEQLFRIGSISASPAGPATLLNNNFDFNVNTSPLLIPDSHLEASNVKIIGGQMRYYDDLYNKRLYVKGSNIMFDNVWFDAPPLGPDEGNLTGMRSMTFKDCRAGTTDYFGFSEYRGYIAAPDKKIIAYGEFTIADGRELSSNSPYLADLSIKINAGSLQRYNYFAATTHTVTVDTTTMTATVPLVFGYDKFVAVGDYFTSHLGVLLGKVSAIDRGTGIATLVNVPLGTSSGSYFITDNYYSYVRGYFAGDVTSGSATISNINWGNILSTPEVGDRVKMEAGIGVIDAINVGAGTVTMSLNSSNTKTGAFFPLTYGRITDHIEYLALVPPNAAAIASYPHLIPEGAIWKEVASFHSSSTRTFQFTQAGYLSPSTVSKTLQARWRQLPDEDGTYIGDGIALPDVTLKRAAAGVLEVDGTGAVELPSGNTGQRPTGAAGRIRYNSDSAHFEGYGTAYKALAWLHEVQDLINVLKSELDTTLISSITTSNSTPTTLDTLTVPAGYAYTFKVLVTAENQDNNEVQTGEKWITIKNVGGTYTVTRTLTTILTDGTAESSSLSTASWTILITGGVPIIQVSPIAATDIKWTAHISYSSVQLTPL